MVIDELLLLFMVLVLFGPVVLTESAKASGVEAARPTAILTAAARFIKLLIMIPPIGLSRPKLSFFIPPPNPFLKEVGFILYLSDNIICDLSDKFVKLGNLSYGFNVSGLCHILMLKMKVAEVLVPEELRGEQIAPEVLPSLWFGALNIC